MNESEPRFTKIRKSYEFVRPIFQHRLNKFVEQNSFVRTFVKRAPVPVILLISSYESQQSTPDHDRYIHDSEYVADIMAEWEE